MRKKMNFICVALGVLFTFFVSIKPVHAWQYETHNTKNMYGVTYQKYWPTSSLTSWQKKQINDELYRWNSSNGTGVYTPIQVTIGANQSQSILDFYYSSNGYNGSGVLGTTYFYVGAGSVDWTRRNWGCAKIYAWGSVYNSVSNSKKIQTWAHETGHGFGLAHNNDRSYPSVMRSWVDGSYNGPTANDLAGINHLYR